MGHFKTNTQRPICGDPLAKYARGKDHFLSRLDKVIDCGEFAPKRLEAYKGNACRGESPYHHLIPFKMLLLANLLNVSERAIEEQCTWFIPVRLFVGLGIHDAVPDHSTLTLFKRRLRKHRGISDFKVVFDGIIDGVIRQAFEKGVRSWSLQIVDSVQTGANVTTRMTGSGRRRDCPRQTRIPP